MLKTLTTEIEKFHRNGYLCYSSNKTRQACLPTPLLTILFKINKCPFSFLMHILCTTGSLHCGIFNLGYSISRYICPCTVNTCNCDMTVSNPLVTPIHNVTTCVNMIHFLQNGCMCVLKDIVDVKQLLNQNSTSFY